MEEKEEFDAVKLGIPIMVIAIIAANVIVYIVLEIMGDTEDAYYMMLHGAVYHDKLAYDKEYWRLFTAIFMHFGFTHIMNNMVMLAASGVILEDALGHIRFAILYILAGVGGSLLSYLQMEYNQDYAVSAGASGAIFGILGALLWVVIRNKGRYESISGKGMILMIVLCLGYGFSTAGVDNWGHIGGLVSGFILGIILYRKKRENVDFIENNQYTNEYK